jgi:phosphatidylinositol glycan class P protein
VLYLFSSLIFLMYIHYSYPSVLVLHAPGIYCGPSRWWGLPFPGFLVMLLVYIHVTLASYNTGYLTVPLSSIETIIDNAANVATIVAQGRTMSCRGGNRGKDKERRKGEAREGEVIGLEGAVESGGGCYGCAIGRICDVLYGQSRELNS